MAYIWYMAVEVDSEPAAKGFAAGFDRSPLHINGHGIWFDIEASLIDGSFWGVTITPCFFPENSGQAVAGKGGVESREHGVLLTEIGNVLLERLLKAPPFKISLLGFECSGFYGFEDNEVLLQDLRDGDDTCHGLVLSAKLWEEAGKPRFCASRRDGTYWIPWKGEV